MDYYVRVTYGTKDEYINSFISNEWRGWTKLPTRTEVDALNSNSNKTTTVTQEIDGTTYTFKFRRIFNLVLLDIPQILNIELEQFQNKTLCTIPNGFKANGSGYMYNFTTTTSTFRDTRIIAHNDNLRAYSGHEETINIFPQCIMWDTADS